MNQKGKDLSSSKGSIQAIRDGHHKNIRRQQIDSAFRQKRKFLVDSNKGSQFQNQQNFPMNYNFIIAPQYQPQIGLPSYFYQAPQPAFHLPFQMPPSLVQNRDLQRREPNVPLLKERPEEKDNFNDVTQDPTLTVLARGQGFKVYDKILGRGTYSTVYEGEEIKTRKRVAVKEVKQMEQNQIKTLSQVASPYIVKMLGYWREKMKTYIVLELCERNLREQLKMCSKSSAIKYFTQVLQGMNVLVSKKIIHRDLKFENILIKDGMAKITDFGLAKSLGDQLEVESVRCGTPYTMAPQIYLHTSYLKKPSYTNKCDIWSLGVLLHQILYERHPFDYEKNMMIRQKMVPIDRKYPILDKFIDKALIFDERQRMSWDQANIIFNQIRAVGIHQKDFRHKHVAKKTTVEQETPQEFQPKIRSKQEQPSRLYFDNSGIPPALPVRQDPAQILQIGQKSAIVEQSKYNKNRVINNPNRYIDQACKRVVHLKSTKPSVAIRSNNNKLIRQQGQNSFVQNYLEKQVRRALKQSEQEKRKNLVLSTVVEKQLESNSIKMPIQYSFKPRFYLPKQLLILLALLIIYNVLI